MHFASDCEKLFLAVGLILLRVVFGSPQLAMLKPKGPKQNAKGQGIRSVFVVGTCVVF